MKSVLKHIPGTKAYKRDLKRRVVGELLKQQMEFDSLSCFSEDERTETYLEIKSHLKEVFMIEERLGKLTNLLFPLLFFPLALFTQFALPVISTEYLFTGKDLVKALNSIAK